MRTPARKGRFTASFLFLLLLFGCAGVRDADRDTPEGNWYRGDLHCHTTHSDGDSGVAAVIGSAEAAGLDFLAVTDHDTSMAGNPSHWYDPDFRSEKLILLYGVEWTSAKGHGNVFSAAPFDYAALWEANRACDAEAAAQAAHREGAYFSVNHPKGLIGAWEYDGLCGADFVEIWNAPFYLPSRNRLAVREFWEAALLEGVRVPAVGGSDNHQLQGYQRNINPHGRPTTWVFAEERSPRGILEGIVKGRVTISASPEAGRLELTADRDGDGIFETVMGDEVTTGRKVTLKLQFVRPPGQEQARESELSGRGAFKSWETYDAVIYKNGRPFLKAALRPAARPWLTVADVPEQAGFYRAELYGTPRAAPAAKALMGETLAVTNPIYIGKR